MAKIEKYEVWAVALLLLIPLFRIMQTRSLFTTWPFLLPALWGIVFLAAVTLLPQTHIRARRSERSLFFGYALSGAILYIALGIMIAAMLKMLNASPYDHSPTGIVSNLFQLLPPLVAREYIRAYALGAAQRKGQHVATWAVAVTLIMTLGEFPLEKFLVLQGVEAWFVFLAKDTLPLLTGNILLTTLAFYGGPGASIAYTGSIRLFQRMFPFLPSLPWIAESAIGIVYPILFAEFVREKVSQQNGARVARGDSGSTVGYAAGLVVAVMFCWFCVGVFPVYPSVVLTGSMEPMIYPGDAVLIRKITTEDQFYQLKEGDVVTFRRENITITHRIVDVLIDEAGNRSLQTKGDNNRSVDEEIVYPEDIRGIVTKVVPKVGIPVLILKSGSELPEGVIDETIDSGMAEQAIYE